MNYAELGQKVKAKYPDYRSLSDYEVGRRVAAKYPDYQAQITETPKNPLQQVADFLVPQSTKALTQLPAQIASKQGKRKSGQGDILQSLQNAAASTADLAAGTVGNPKLVAELASWAAPIGKSFKAAAGLGATAGGLQAASQEEATPQSVATGAVTGGVAGPVLKGAGALLGKGTQKAGQKVKEQGEQLVLRGLKPSPSQLTKFKERTGKDLADWLNKQGITGNFPEEAAARIDELQTQFDDLAVRSGATVKAGKLQQLFIKRMEAMKDSIVPGVKAKAEDVKQIMDNLVAKYGDDIDVGKLTQERRAVDGYLKEGQFTLPIEQASYLRSVRDGLQEAIQDATKGMGEKDLKTIGLELRDLYEFQKIAQKQSNLGRGTNLMGLINMLGAGTGGVIGGFPGVIGGVLASKALQSPRVIRGLSKGARVSGKGIEELGKKTAVDGRFEALQRALRNVTSAQMSRSQLP